jgi:hypothetical protein
MVKKWLRNGVNVEMKLLFFGNYSADQRTFFLGQFPRNWRGRAKGGKTLSSGYWQKLQQLHSHIYTSCDILKSNSTSLKK